jgi:5S rRNA maturation endonuclease (ribonuclease M5)
MSTKNFSSIRGHAAGGVELIFTPVSIRACGFTQTGDGRCEMNPKFDDRPLDEIAQDVFEWCLSRGCEKLGETPKEYRIQCPNMNCPSRQKSGTHKAFDINKETAKFNCFHCGLKGQGLHGSKGLITTLESGDFSPSAFSGKQNINVEFFKPKEKVVAEPVMGKDELPSIAKALSKEAVAYFVKRGIHEYVYRDTDLRIFSLPVGGQLSFMKQPLSDTAIFFPIRNDEGEVIHVHYKLLHGGYYMSPGPKPVYQTKKTALNDIVIVEGVFDALSVYTAGYRGVALLGHEITGNHDLNIFKDKPVVVMLDNDDAGKASVNSVASVLATVASEVKIATIPSELGKDANDVLVMAGVEKLKEVIQNAKRYNIESARQTNSTTEQETTDTDIPQEQTTAKVEVIKPKKETGIGFPKEAWRGLFEIYRQAQKGTTEAPDQYHFGVFKTVAGIVVGRTAYLWNGRKLFPNFYTVLIGPTTQSRKSTAASRGTSLLSDLDENGEMVGADPLVLVLRGLSTSAGLIAHLRIPSLQQEEELDGLELKRALSTSLCEGYRALIVIDEFASLLRQAKKEYGSGIVQTLTEAYDGKSALQNPTKVDPTVAKNPVVAMICLSTREWLENTLEMADIFGGYVGRNLFYEWTPTEPIPNPDEPNQSLLNEITVKLQGIRRDFENRGKQQRKYCFDDDAISLLDAWYIERWNTVYASEVTKAAIQRIDENVRKLSLLYAVLENDFNDLTIHADQLQAAIKVGEYWATTAKSIIGQFGGTQATRNELKILELVGREGMTKRDLHHQISGRMTAKQIDEILRYLLSVERVRIVNDEYEDSLGRKRKRKLYVLGDRSC